MKQITAPCKEALNDVVSELSPCACANPLIGERKGGYARCRLCNGYITANYINGLAQRAAEMRAEKDRANDIAMEIMSELNAARTQASELNRRYDALSAKVDERLALLEGENKRLVRLYTTLCGELAGFNDSLADLYLRRLGR